MQFIVNILNESWLLLLDAAPFIIFGLIMGGILKVFLSPAFIAGHLGRGRFLPVLKAALFGIPIPLCSCGVLPAAAALKKQGANNGATTAFLISTPESGVDSMAVTYALLDPLMTVARPVAAFISAMAAGIIENLWHSQTDDKWTIAERKSTENIQDKSSRPQANEIPPSFLARLGGGLKYAAVELWGDLAGWFAAGLLLAGVITVILPQEIIAAHLGGGLQSMLLMLVFAIPMYICATASTPIAAALILKGVSPGAALVFLLVGPATNITSLSVLFGILGKRATFIYLAVVAVFAVLAGLCLDLIHEHLALDPVASLGQAGEMIPAWLSHLAALILIALTLAVCWRHFSSYRDKPGAPDNCCCPSGKEEMQKHKKLLKMKDHRT